MDLQLNLSTSNVKNNKVNKKQKGPKSNSSEINFAKKPAIEGKIIAKRRNVNSTTAAKSTFSFLKNESKEKSVKILSEYIPKKNTSEVRPSSPIKHIDNTLDVDSDCGDFSLNITNKNIPKQAKKKDFEKNAGPSNKFKQKDKKPFDNKKDFNNKGQKNQSDGNNVQDKNKQPTFKQIQALFRNNPEIPKIGQRHVKPINEKLFSGKTFSDLNIHSFSVANLEKNLQLTQLTVVQQKATPVILNGRDVLVRSQTGSGKTLAYALPIVEALGALRPKLKRHDGIKALIIVPTRELALQTYELFVKLMRPYTWVVPGYLIGGENRKAEKARLRKGFNILIGTPGRICDHLKNTTSLKLDYTRCLILDEADRLLDMGYEKDVASIVQALESHKIGSTYNPLAIMRQNIKTNHVRFDDNEEDNYENKTEEIITEPVIESPSKADDEVTAYQHELSNVFLSEKRQTVLLSATLTKAVETLAGLTMNNPVFIDSSEDRGTLIADSIARPIANEDITDKNQSDENDDVDNDDDDLEIVPQEDDENDDEQSDENDESDDEQSEGDQSGDEQSEDGNESDNEEESDSESNDESDTDDDEDKNKKNVSVYKGLKAFGGIKSETVSSKKTKEKNKTDKKKSEKVAVTKVTVSEKEGSDSDSDYDFFAAVKSKPPSKPPQDKPPQDTIITDSGTHSNPFQNAIKNAIAQDEMVIPSSVTQIYIVVPMKLRLVTLSSLIVERCVTSGSGKMLVFMATQDMIDYHCEILSRVLTGKTPKKIIADTNAKKQKKKKGEASEEIVDETNNQPKETDVDASPKKESKEKNDGNEDYEYNYNGIPLEEYEKQMRAKEAFVDVEFFQLHGSMDQKTRTEVFKTFRKANSGVLLCTDVAARGLDLPHVDCIVQYTGPINATDYLHRVGRTARAGNVGTAYMFLLPSEVLFVRQLEERRIRLHQEDMEKTLGALNRRKSSGKMLKGRQAAEEAAAAALQQTYEDLVEADKELFVKSCKAFTSWMRFYSTYPREARAAFDRRALHAGHAARALALRVAPKQVAKSAPRDKQEKPNNRLSNQRPNREEDPDKKKKKPEGIPAGFDVKPTSVKSAKRDRLMMISEFDSGLEPSKKKKKK